MNKQFFINISDENVVTKSSQINCNKEHINVINQIFNFDLKSTKDLKSFLKKQPGEELSIKDIWNNNKKITFCISKDNKQNHINLYENDKKFKFTNTEDIFDIKLDQKIDIIVKFTNNKYDPTNVIDKLDDEDIDEILYNSINLRAKENYDGKYTSTSVMEFINKFSSDSKLKISYYQREYVMNETLSWTLVYDTLVKDQNIGGEISLIENDKVYEVFDGQQRITSILLFLYSFKIFYITLNKDKYDKSILYNIFSNLPKIKFEEECRTQFYTELSRVNTITEFYNLFSNSKFKNSSIIELQFIDKCIREIKKLTINELSKIHMAINTKYKIKFLTYNQNKPQNQSKNLAQELFSIYNSPSTEIESYEKFENYLLMNLKSEENKELINYFSTLKNNYYTAGDVSKINLNKVLGYTAVYYLFSYNDELQSEIIDLLNSNKLQKQFPYLTSKYVFDHTIIYELFTALYKNNTNVINYFNFTNLENKNKYEIIFSMVYSLFAKKITWNQQYESTRFSYTSININDKKYIELIRSAFDIIKKIINLKLDREVEKYIYIIILLNYNINNDELKWIFLQSYLINIFSPKNLHNKNSNLLPNLSINKAINFDQFKSNYIKKQKYSDETIENRLKNIINEIRIYVNNNTDENMLHFSHRNYQKHRPIFYLQFNNSLDLELEHLIEKSTFKISNGVEANSLSNLWMCTKSTHEEIQKKYINKLDIENWNDANDQKRIEILRHINNMNDKSLIEKELLYFEKIILG